MHCCTLACACSEPGLCGPPKLQPDLAPVACSLVGSEPLAPGAAIAGADLNGHAHAGPLPGPPAGSQGFSGPAGGPGLRPPGAGFAYPGAPRQEGPGFSGPPGPMGPLGRGPAGHHPGPGMPPGFRPSLGPPHGVGPGMAGGPAPLAAELDSLLTHTSARDRAKTEKCARPTPASAPAPTPPRPAASACHPKAKW